MKKEFVMRGQTASGQYEILNFSGYKPAYAYRLVDFRIWPSTNIGGVGFDMSASITAGKLTTDDPPVSPANPANPDFNQEGLIGNAIMQDDANPAYPVTSLSLVNDTFLITQNLILSVIDVEAGSPMPVNWQCRFVSVKMTGPEEATANYKQFAISDE